MDTTDREIKVERLFDAPRDLVFKAWSDPEHLIKWWGPRGFTNTFHTFNMTPGGIWKYVMHGPDGTDYDNLISFIEVVVPEKLVYHHGSGKENDPFHFHVTVTFEDHGHQTLLTMKSVFPTAAMRDQVVREFGALEGANQTLDKLGELLLTL